MIMGYYGYYCMDSMVYFSSLLPIQMLNAKEPVAIIIAYIYIYILKLDEDGMIQLEFTVVYNDWIVELDCVVP